MDYLKLTFTNVDKETQELIIAKLSEFDFIGFEQKETHLLAYAENHQISSQVYEEILQDFSFSSEVLPEVNWNERWERDFDPIIIEDKVVIRAHFHKPMPLVTHEIIVTPKMSFGTGHHATTQLMLEQMSTLNYKGKKVLDYGTGTGVLAIYAELLGANYVLANDIDPWSEENAKENLERNHCKKVEVRLGGIEVIFEDTFDCILANINLNVLRESMHTLFSKLKKDGSSLIISGVLQENKEDIINEIKPYSVDYQVFDKNTWLCIHVKY